MDTADRNDPRNWPSYQSYVDREAQKPNRDFQESIQPGSEEASVAMSIATKFNVPLPDVFDDLEESQCRHRRNLNEEDALEAGMYDEYGEMVFRPDEE